MEPEINLYQTLGITKNALPQEIKLAYYRSVRMHPPEKDPDGFQRVRHAYEILSNPTARSNYDAMDRFGEKINASYEKGVTLCNNGDYQAASSKFKFVLLLAPNLDIARDMLAFCHFRLKEYEKSLEQISFLIDRDEPLPFYLHNAARVRHQWAQDLINARENPEEANRLLDEALSLYTRAAKAEPINSEHHIGIAEVLLTRKQYDEALANVERAIEADGKFDFQDFDALFFACIIQISKDDLEGVNRTVQRILSVVGEEGEHRAYVAWRFGNLALDLAEAYGFNAALEVARAAQCFDPGEENYRVMVGHFQDIVSIESEYSHLQDDDEFLRYLFALELQLSTAPPDRLKELEGRWNELMGNLKRMDPEKLFRYADKIKNECPAFYKRHAPLVDNIIEITRSLYPLMREAQEACQDRELPRILRLVCALTHDMLIDVDGVHADAQDRKMDQSMQVVAREPKNSIILGIERIKRIYPILYESQKKLWDYIKSMAGSQRAWWQKLFGG